MTSPPQAPAPSLCMGGTLFKFGVLPYKSHSTLEDEVGGWPSQETDSRGGSLIFSPDNPPSGFLHQAKAGTLSEARDLSLPAGISHCPQLLVFVQ